MNTFLLILGLTIIYYVVLFYFDKKRKKAFQLAKNNAIRKTAKLPSIEEIKPEDPENGVLPMGKKVKTKG